jgi:excisionase family DNA binding protein
VGEDRTDAHNVGRGGDRLTIAEAATLLGVHRNTVRNRIKNGSYRAEMVQTERGPTYLIERESLLTNLTTNTLSSASQDVVSPQAMDFVQELLRPFVSELGAVREELGAERARREVAETTLHEGMAEERRRREEAERERDVLRRGLHARGRQQGSHEADEEQQGRGQPQSAASGPPGSARPRPWWRRIIGG